MTYSAPSRWQGEVRCWEHGSRQKKQHISWGLSTSEDSFYSIMHKSHPKRTGRVMLGSHILVSRKILKYRKGREWNPNVWPSTLWTMLLWSRAHRGPGALRSHWPQLADAMSLSEAPRLAGPWAAHGLFSPPLWEVLAPAPGRDEDTPHCMPYPRALPATSREPVGQTWGHSPAGDSNKCLLTSISHVSSKF